LRTREKGWVGEIGYPGLKVSRQYMEMEGENVRVHPCHIDGPVVVPHEPTGQVKKRLKVLTLRYGTYR
jgi:hypothetical protein